MTRIMSIRVKIVLIGIAAVLVFGLFVGISGYTVFHGVVTDLYLQDLDTRLQSFRYEYGDIDSRTMATEEADIERDELIARMRARYVERREMQAVPFIINSDREMQLYPEAAMPAGEEHFREAVGDEILAVEDRQNINLEIEDQRFVASVFYYEPWEWYSGYLVPESTLRAGPVRFASIVAGIGILLVVVFALLYIMYLNRMLETLLRLPGAMERFVEGDTTVRVNADSTDEIGAIARSFNSFAENLKGILDSIEKAVGETREIETQLREESNATADNVSEITEDATTIARRISLLENRIGAASRVISMVTGQIDSLESQIADQASQVEESSAAVEEMSASLSNVARITEEKRGSVGTLRDSVDRGGTQLIETDEAIRKVQQKVDEIRKLSEMLSDMAGQTDVLSINASIEAAHAGERGSGFAVVAGEVRNLASTASKSSRDISAAVTEIANQIQSAAEISDGTKSVFNEIRGEVSSVEQAFDEISTSNSELAAGGRELTGSMHRLQEISTSVHEQSSQARSLNDRIAGGMKEVSRLAGEIDEAAGHITTKSGETDASMQGVREKAQRLHDAGEGLTRALGAFGQ
ncbi:MAG: methyl-accepting chemotaxis protein [bacterium]